MTVASERGLLTPADLDWPITWRFHFQLPWGRTQQELSVNAPAAVGSIEMSMNLGLEVWSRGIAPAMTNDVELVAHDTVAWKFAPAALPMSHFGARGPLAGTAAPRDRTPCLMMHTGHGDPLAIRRMFVPGVPSRWVDESYVNAGGLVALQTWARGLYIGLASQHTGGPMQWLIAYPEELPADAGNPNGVAFRRMDWLRLCWHVERAPQPSSEPWP